MTVAQMRVAVYEAYQGNGWHKKVDNMSDVQVQAVYFSLLDRGFFDRKPPAKTNQYGEKLAESLAYEPYVGDQLSLKF